MISPTYDKRYQSTTARKNNPLIGHANDEFRTDPAWTSRFVWVSPSVASQVCLLSKPKNWRFWWLRKLADGKRSDVKWPGVKQQRDGDDDGRWWWWWWWLIMMVMIVRIMMIEPFESRDFLTVATHCLFTTLLASISWKHSIWFICFFFNGFIWNTCTLMVLDRFFGDAPI